MPSAAALAFSVRARSTFYFSTNDLPTEIPLAGDMGGKAQLISVDEGPLYVMPCNVEAAQTIATDKVWPGGSGVSGLPVKYPHPPPTPPG